MPNYHCCVPLCENDSRYKENLSFHHFPVDENIRKEWIAKIRRDVGEFFQVTKSTVVCSAHFKPEEIKVTQAGKRVLFSKSVPSIFSWITSKKRKSPRKRLFLTPGQCVESSDSDT